MKLNWKWQRPGCLCSIQSNAHVVFQGGMSVDSITDLDDNQSRLLEALQLSLPAETQSKKEKHRDKRLSLNPIYRQVPRVVDSCCQHVEKYGEQLLHLQSLHTYVHPALWPSSVTPMTAARDRFFSFSPQVCRRWGSLELAAPRKEFDRWVFWVIPSFTQQSPKPQHSLFFIKLIVEQMANSQRQNYLFNINFCFPLLYSVLYIIYCFHCA